MPETLAGQVTDLRLYSGGWGILRVRASSDDRESTVTGHPLGVKLGDTIQATGRWDDHPRWGRQFVASEIRTVVPSDAAGAIGWIASRIVGLGRKRAAQLVEVFGIPEVWAVLQDPAKLAEQPGISGKRAAAIVESYIEEQAGREQAVELKGWGLTDGQIAAVRKAWGSAAIERLREDPFQLIEKVRGFGFKRADAVARRMGLPSDHPARIDAALMHVLGEAEKAGHCYVPNGRLLGMAERLLGLDRETVGPRLRHVCDGERGARVGPKIYSARVMRAEASVAAKVRALLGRGASEKREAA